MRTRIDILQDLVWFKGELQALQYELAQYSWDTQNPILIITNNDIVNVLRSSIDNRISIDEISEWANLIECRDDFGFVDAGSLEIIFELANPEINGQITKERLEEMITELKD